LALARLVPVFSKPRLDDVDESATMAAAKEPRRNDRAVLADHDAPHTATQTRYATLIDAKIVAWSASRDPVGGGANQQYFLA
jgi:hypothetical protein